MRWVIVALVATSCYRESAPPRRERAATTGDPERDQPRTHDRSRTMTSVGPATCATDADCRVSYAGPACCPGATCGGVVSVGQIAAFQAFCRGVDCGPPVPSSSCLGIIGLEAVCRQGTCEGKS